jgi:hypothetical protein
VPDLPALAAFDSGAGLAFVLAADSGFAFAAEAGLALVTDFVFDTTFVFAFIAFASLWLCRIEDRRSAQRVSLTE